jgi:hypothetical protein
MDASQPVYPKADLRSPGRVVVDTAARPVRTNISRRSPVSLCGATALPPVKSSMHITVGNGLGKVQVGTAMRTRFPGKVQAAE